MTESGLDSGNGGTILGFDTSTGELSVALAARSTVLAERAVGPDDGGRPRHASALLPAIEEVLAAGGGWDDVERIAVGVGPGTFTGLRIGVTTARALAQARGLGLAGVSSLATLAAGVDPAHPEASRPRLAVIDAKRGEAFTALYDSAGEERWSAWVGPPTELAERVAALDAAPLAVGDGSIRFRNQLAAAGAVVPADDDPAHRLRARHLCRLAEATQDDRDIEPNYLRRPDAELWRERDHGSSNSS